MKTKITSADLYAHDSGECPGDETCPICHPTTTTIQAPMEIHYLDDYEQSHLEKWCANQFGPVDADDNFNAAIFFLAGLEEVDARYWIDRGWRELFNHIGEIRT